MTMNVYSTLSRLPWARRSPSSVAVVFTSTVVRLAVSRRGRTRDANEMPMTATMPSISRRTASTGTLAMTLGFVAVHGG
jgi:hypothetical protein